MDIKKYNVKRSNLFRADIKGVLKYIADNLQNPIASENMLDAVEKRIKKMSSHPLIYPKYKSKKYTYYKIQVKSFTIFYVVQDNTIILSRFLYNRRNFKKLI